MTDYEYDEYQEVMKQALLTMNELLDVVACRVEDKEREEGDKNDYNKVRQCGYYSKTLR